MNIDAIIFVKVVPGGLSKRFGKRRDSYFGCSLIRPSFRSSDWLLCIDILQPLVLIES